MHSAQAEVYWLIYLLFLAKKNTLVLASGIVIFELFAHTQAGTKPTKLV